VRRLAAAAGAAVAGALLVVAPLADPAAAKSFEIEAVEVEAVVRPDGSMDVVEHLTYDFDGTYNVGDRDIPPGSYTVVDMRASEGGQPRATINPSPWSFEWDLGGASGRHTYDISYRVVGVTAVGPDVGELYWQFVGTDFPHVDRVRVVVHVPGDGAGVRAWAHGPLHGIVGLDGPRVTLDVDDLDAGVFVEARVAIPSSVFSVPPTGEPRLPAILEEEGRLADEANRLREEARRRQEREEDARRLANLAGIPVALAGALALFAVWRRWGRDPRPPDDIGEYWREVPEDPPAVVMANLEYGSVSPDALSATLVDLAQRGWLTIAEEGDDHRFTRAATDPADDALAPFEASLLDRLFARGPSVTKDEFVDHARGDRTASATWLRSFLGAIASEYRQRGYRARTGCLPYVLWTVVAVVLGGFGFVFGLGLTAWFALPALAVAVVAMALTVLLRRRSDIGSRRVAEAESLRRFLRDFSLVDDVPVGHLALYERYLVYAVALSVADRLVEGLRVRLPQVVDDPGFAPWYGMHGGGGNGFRDLGGIGGFADDFASATKAASTPPSSASGGGGGFSGGGGGGGGGGGAGAH
jgi:uncharacterized membrane protein